MLTLSIAKELVEYNHIASVQRGSYLSESLGYRLRIARHRGHFSIDSQSPSINIFVYTMEAAYTLIRTLRYTPRQPLLNSPTGGPYMTVGCHHDEVSKHLTLYQPRHYRRRPWCGGLTRGGSRMLTVGY